MRQNALQESFFIKQTWIIFLDYFGHKYVFSCVRDRYVRIIWLLIKTIIFVKMQNQEPGPWADPQALLPLAPSPGFGCPAACPWPALTECRRVTTGPAAMGSLLRSPSCLLLQGAGCSSALSLRATNSPSPTGLSLDCWSGLLWSLINTIVFGFNRIPHMLTFMHMLRIILDMHSLTKFTHGLRS